MKHHESTLGWEWAQQNADLIIDLPEGEVMHFQKISAGSFRMGSRGEYADEEPVHEACIPEDFYLGTFPVNQAQYRVMARACLGSLKKIEGNRGVDPSEFKGLLNPVENVSWEDVRVIAQFLSDLEILPAGYFASLPTEAYWEYACRAGSDTGYANGDGEACLSEMGWFSGNAGGQTHPVGSKTPNHWGLYDCHGNVYEWCQDLWDESKYRLTVDGDHVPLGEDQADRVLRGGSWVYAARFCRSAYRGRGWPGGRGWSIGFRLGLFPGPGPEAQSRRSEPASGAGSDGTERKAQGAGGVWEDARLP